MNRPLIDISRPLAATTACWPGDIETALRRNASLAEGASVNLSSITASVHNATHADASLHYSDNGVPIEQHDLARYIGRCVVVSVIGRELIEPGDLPDDLPPRVLFRTDGWPDSGTFPAFFPTLSEAAVTHLGSQGVQLIGVDVPSVDVPTSKTLPIHHALHAADICIVESLDLNGVTPGSYELIALPILIAGSDGAFVRAVLRPYE